MEWPLVRLAALVERIGGGTPSRKVAEYWGAGLPWFTVADLDDGLHVQPLSHSREFITDDGLKQSAAQRIPTGAVVISTRVVVGKVGLATNELATNQDFCSLIPRSASSLDSRFLAYFLLFIRRSLRHQQRGLTISGIRTRDLDELQVPLPPLSEQRRIVEILDQTDRLRRLRAEADTKADRILPALFLKMFGDPATNPMGWVQRPLCELATVTTGNTPSRKKTEYYGDHLEWVKSDNLNTPSHYITPTSERLSERGASVGRRAPSGSTLVTCIAGSPSAIGNAALANREVAFNQQINAATPREGVTPYFLYAQFVVGNRLVQAASTGGMKGMVSKSRFCDITFLAPPQNLQEDFGHHCMLLCDQNEIRLEQTGRLKRLFSHLLNHGFSGELTASWREAHMKALLQEMEQQAKALAGVTP